MNVTLAKTAGFCYGVNRAVNMVEELTKNGEKVCTLGPIIHNTQMVEKLKSEGVRIVNTPEELLEYFRYIGTIRNNELYLFSFNCCIFLYNVICNYYDFVYFI